MRIFCWSSSLVTLDSSSRYPSTYKTYEPHHETSSPRATIAHLRVNKYSHWTKCCCFFVVVVVVVVLTYMGMTVMFQGYGWLGCNSFYRIIEAVLTCTHNICFEQQYQKYQIFFFFQFLQVKNFCILHGQVFITRYFQALTSCNDSVAFFTGASILLASKKIFTVSATSPWSKSSNISFKLVPNICQQETRIYHF